MQVISLQTFIEKSIRKRKIGGIPPPKTHNECYLFFGVECHASCFHVFSQKIQIWTKFFLMVTNMDFQGPTKAPNIGFSSQRSCLHNPIKARTVSFRTTSYGTIMVPLWYHKVPYGTVMVPFQSF